LGSFNKNQGEIWPNSAFEHEPIDG